MDFKCSFLRGNRVQYYVSKYILVLQFTQTIPAGSIKWTYRYEGKCFILNSHIKPKQNQALLGSNLSGIGLLLYTVKFPARGTPLLFDFTGIAPCLKKSRGLGQSPLSSIVMQQSTFHRVPCAQFPDAVSFCCSIQCISRFLPSIQLHHQLDSDRCTPA